MAAGRPGRRNRPRGRPAGACPHEAGPAVSWGQVSTTGADQLALLADLATARSPLEAAARAYELSLLRAVGPARRWGVPAAASPGTLVAVQDGERWAGPARHWVINSIGVLDRHHRELLLAVLSDGQPSRAAGVALDEAAAVVAATCMITLW